jgi:hypothetical protein
MIVRFKEAPELECRLRHFPEISSLILTTRSLPAGQEVKPVGVSGKVGPAARGLRTAPNASLADQKLKNVLVD